MTTRIRPIVRGFGPVAPGGGAAVGATLQGVGEALGALGDLQTNRELLDIRAQAQADALQARQIEKMERSEAIAQFTAKQIVRNEQASRIVTEAREGRDFSNVQQDMDRWESDFNENLFEGRSQQFKDIFEVMDRGARVGSINKLGTAVEGGTLRIIADNYQISVDNLVESVNEFSDPAEINEQFDSIDEAGINMGFTQASIEATSGQGRREAMEKYVRSLPIVDGLAALADPDVASALGNEGREVMRRDLNATANSLERNNILTSRVTELLTGINVIRQLNRGASESDVRNMIEGQEGVSPAAKKDAFNQLEIWALSRQRGPQPITPDQLRSNHVLSEQSMDVILNNRKLLEDEDLDNDDRQEAYLELNRQGLAILSEATQLAAQGQFNEDKLTELAFQMAPLTEGLFLFEEESKSRLELMKTLGKNLLLGRMVLIPFNIAGAALRPGGDKRIPNAIISDVRRDMFLGQGRYEGLSSAQRSVMGRILIAEAIKTEGSDQPIATEEAIALAEGVFERSAIRFMSEEFGLVGDDIEQVRGILFKDGPPAIEPKQQINTTELINLIREGFDQGFGEQAIRNRAKRFAGFNDEAFDRSVAIVDRATAEAPALPERQ